MKRSKRYIQALNSFDKTKLYEMNEAFDIIKSLPGTKFDESVELHIRLGVRSRDMPTSRFVVPLFCPMEQVNNREFWYLPKAKKQRKLKMPERIM